MPFDIISIITTKVYPAILVLFFFGLTIFIHELGHFLVAKWRGLKIERFSIGFGPKIFGWTGKDGVDYRVSWLPFGGYVALPQMSPMETIEGKTEAKADELPAVSPLSKILVAVAGPIMNVILAIFMATILWQVGLPMPVNPPIIGWVDRGSVEEQKGMRPGDRIVQIDDTKVKTWEDVMETVAFSREPSLRIVYERDSQQFECLIDPTLDKVLGFKSLELSPVGHPFAKAIIAGRPAEAAGVQPGDKFLMVEHTSVVSSRHLQHLLGVRAGEPTHLTVLRNGKEVTMLVAPEYDPTEKAGRIGVQLGEDFKYEVQRPGPTPYEQISSVLGKMGRLLGALMHSKETGIGAKDMSGPVGIMGGFWYEIMAGGFLRGMSLAVLLNINLAILNMLPLPVLDGGHIMLSILEAIRRKPLNARVVYVTSMAFAALLISFMLYVTWFDLDRFVFWRFKPAPATQTNDAISTTESNQP